MPKEDEKPESKLSPDQQEKVQELESDLKRVTPLDTLARSAGGKILIDGLLTDIVSNIDTLCANYKTMTMQEFVANACGIKEKLDLARAIKNAKDAKAFLENELKETLAQS